MYIYTHTGNTFLLLRTEIPNGAAIWVRSLSRESRERLFCAGLVHDVTDTDCWAQSADTNHGRVIAPFQMSNSRMAKNRF